MRGSQGGTDWKPLQKVKQRKVHDVDVLTDEEKQQVYEIIRNYHDQENKQPVDACALLQSTQRKIASKMKSFSTPRINMSKMKKRLKRDEWFKQKKTKLCIMTENDKTESLWLQMSILGETVFYPEVETSVNSRLNFMSDEVKEYECTVNEQVIEENATE